MNAHAPTDARPAPTSGRLSVVHVLASMDADQGGPSRSVVQLADALARRPDLEVTLLSQQRAGEPPPAPSGGAARCLAASSSARALSLGLPARRELRRLVAGRRPLLLHSHGIWLPINHWASRTGRNGGVPVVIHPRGMLEPWAVAYKPWRKRLAMRLFQKRDLDGAAALVASSPAEYEGIRRLGFRQPVAVIPIGIPFETGAGSPALADPAGDRERTVLFLSRIHPGKGLVTLLRAWSGLSPAGWRLVVAGPDDGGHLAEVLDERRRLGLESSVAYLGALEGAAKEAAYRGADLFVLPTLGESFGIVVAEALAHGVPVITTRGAPWQDLERVGCGWWIEAGVEPLARALRSAMGLSDGERRGMGARGRDYVRRYDWDAIAQQTAALYAWILGGPERPECVRLD